MPKMSQPQVTISLLAAFVLTGSVCLAESKIINPSNTVAEKSSVSVYSLDKAINYALDNNPDLQIASERIAQAEARLGEAWSAFYPQISARVGYQVSNNPAQVFGMMVAQREFNTAAITNINHPGFRENFRPEINGSISLYRGGQDYANTKIANLSVEAADLEHSTLRNALVQAVSASYYSYFAAQEAEKVAQNSISAIDSQLDQTRKRFNAGTVLRSDVLSLEAKLAEAQEAQIKAANGVELAKSSLSVLLGLPVSQDFTVAPAANLYISTQTKSFKELLSQALAQRPEIQAAAKQIEIAEQQVQSEKGGYLPKVDAFVSYGQDNQNPGYSFAKDNVTAGVQVEVDLFSGFRTKQRVSAAERKLAEVQEQDRKTRLNIEQEVHAAHLKLNEALARLKVTEAAVKSAEEALRLVSIQRQAEVVTVTRYIEAQSAANQAHSNAVAAHYDALTAQAALKKALGEWK
jgi:outer membrane protein TolC